METTYLEAFIHVASTLAFLAILAIAGASLIVAVIFGA